MDTFPIQFNPTEVDAVVDDLLGKVANLATQNTQVAALFL